MGHGPLPAFLTSPNLSARLWVAVAAGIGCAACAYAGLYPRFDAGSLRVVLALTSAPFAAAVIAAALSAHSAGSAFARAIGLAAILGVASTIVPAAILSNPRSGEFVGACMFGAFFGAPTGVLYGLPLATLAACSWKHVRASSHDASDRASRVAGVWLVGVAALAILTTSVFDAPRMDYDTGAMMAPPRGPALAAWTALVASVVVIVRSTVQLRRRSRWIDRVRDGLEPNFRLRPMDLRDGIDVLPRLGHGTTVIEWLPEEEAHARAGHAYRTAALGVAVAVVADEVPIGL